MGAGLVDLPMYAIWALQPALEGTMKRIRGAPDEIDRDPTSVEKLPVKVEVAAVWIKYAGRKLYGRDEQVYGTQGGPLWRLNKKEAQRLGRQYKGTQGLCSERWALWKARFGEIAECEGVDPHVRHLAGEAGVEMENIETEDKF